MNHVGIDAHSRPPPAADQEYPHPAVDARQQRGDVSVVRRRQYGGTEAGR
jgi:hypothetical protein